MLLLYAQHFHKIFWGYSYQRYYEINIQNVTLRNFA